jgi:hypothetical protein
VSNTGSAQRASSYFIVFFILELNKIKIKNCAIKVDFAKNLLVSRNAGDAHFIG